MLEVDDLLYGDMEQSFAENDKGKFGALLHNKLSMWVRLLLDFFMC